MGSVQSHPLTACKHIPPPADAVLGAASRKLEAAEFATPWVVLASLSPGNLFHYNCKDFAKARTPQMKATNDRRGGETSKEAENSYLRSFHLSHLLFQSCCGERDIPFDVGK